MDKYLQTIQIILLALILIAQLIGLGFQSQQDNLPSAQCRQERAEMLNLIQAGNETIGQIYGLMSQASTLPIEERTSMYQLAQLGVLQQLATNNIQIYKIFVVCP